MNKCSMILYAAFRVPSMGFGKIYPVFTGALDFSDLFCPLCVACYIRVTDVSKLDHIMV
jgi:hypothetical protein